MDEGDELSSLQRLVARLEVSLSREEERSRNAETALVRARNAIDSTREETARLMRRVEELTARILRNQGIIGALNVARNAVVDAAVSWYHAGMADEPGATYNKRLAQAVSEYEIVGGRSERLRNVPHEPFGAGLAIEHDAAAAVESTPAVAGDEPHDDPAID